MNSNVPIVSVPEHHAAEVHAAAARPYVEFTDVSKAFGSHVVLEASPDYVLGRPRIGEIEVRFILDLSTMVAGIAATSVA